MTLVKQMARTTALGVAMLIGSGLYPRPAQAGYIVTLEQVGPNVVATGSGPIDLTGLTGPLAPGGNPRIFPSVAAILTGPPGPVSAIADGYIAMGPGSAPTSFGSGGFTIADTGSGDPVGIGPGAPPNLLELTVPMHYASGDPLSDSSTYDNQTFTTLGVTPGTYEWTWGTGANQNFTLQIGPAAVPEPSSLALLGVALAGLPFVQTRRRSLDAGRGSYLRPKISD